MPPTRQRASALALALAAVCSPALGDEPGAPLEVAASPPPAGSGAGAARRGAFVDESTAMVGLSGGVLASGSEPRSGGSGIGMVGLSVWGVAGHADGMQVRNTLHAGVGLENGELAGRASHELGLGGLIAASSWQGLYLRGGLRLEWLGSRDLYFTAIELPRASAGWGLYGPHSLVEVGAAGGVVLDGRFNPAGDFRRLNLLSWGLEARAHAPWVDLEAFFGRIEPTRLTDRGPVELARARACLATGLSVCGEAMMLRGRVVVPFEGERVVQSSYAGLSVGGRFGASGQAERE